MPLWRNAIDLGDTNVSADSRTPPGGDSEGRPNQTTTGDQTDTDTAMVPPAVDDEGEAWPDPRPLTETVARTTFPTSALPDKVAAFVRSAARSIGVDEGVIGTVVLAVLSAATVGRVRVKAWGSLVERTVLWVLVIAEPGERKTSVFALARKPLEKVQAELVTEAMKDRRAALGRLAAANAALKEAEKQLAAAYGAADDPERDEDNAPDLEAANERVEAAARRVSDSAVDELPRLVASDVTPEALHDLMAAHGGRMALLIPEGQSLLHRLANAGSGADLEPYLAGHAGDTMYKDRVTRSVDPVEDPSLVMAVMTQPEVFSSKATDEMKWSGFLDRFLLVRPRSLAGTRSARSPEVGAFELMDYQQTIAHMVRAFWTLEEPRVVGLSREAEEIAVAFHDEIEPTLRRGAEVPGRSPGWAKKLVGAMLRTAGTLAVADDPMATEVSAGQVQAAIDLMRFYEAHTSTVNRTLLNPSLSEQLGWATKVLGALARLHEKGHRHVTTREVVRGTYEGTNEPVTKALGSLAELGWVIRESHRDVGTAVGNQAWALHPGLSQWAEKYR
ncbi:DUF3987 domain-containing protein [Gordonia amarae]|nr:DUF3987 domain-containing protein [Gordonia amarae]